MGRVKELLPEDDEYSAYAEFGYEQELEMLAVDAEQAAARLEAAKLKADEGRQRKEAP